MRSTPGALSKNAGLNSLNLSERWDIAVKWRFLRDQSDPEAERVYREHIEKRNGGVEKNGSGNWKRSVDDFVDASRALLLSMRETGFDPAHRIVRGRNGRLMDGAHRWACSILLGIEPVIVTVERDGTATWGEGWFCQFMPNDVERVRKDWECLVRS